MRKAYLIIPLFITLHISCKSNVKLNVSAKTPDDLFKSSLLLLSEDKYEELVNFSVLPSTIEELKSVPGKYDKAMTKFQNRKDEAVKELIILSKEKPIKFSDKKFATYRISSDHTVDLTYLNDRWYFNK